MISWWTRSVGGRVVGGAVTLLALSFALSGWFNIETQRAVLLGSVDRQGNLMSHLAALACREAMLSLDYPVLESYAEALVGEADQVVFARIERADGTVVTEAGRPRATDSPVSIRRALICLSPEGECRHDAQLVPDDHELLGQVVIGLSTLPVRQAIADSGRNIMWQAVLTFASLAVLLLALLKWLVGDPLRRLDRAAQRLGGGDLDRPVHWRRRDEFGRLAQSLDSMRVGLRSSYREIHEQNERLRHVDRLKSEFLANVSHEIRTPMHGILGFSDVLLETELNQEQREMVATVQTSARGLLAIINDILDFSKSEAGALRLEETSVDVRSIVEDVAQLLAAQAHAKGLELVADVDPTLDSRVTADPLRLRQVLANLAGNAVKFTERGEVVLRARVLDQDGDRLRVCFEVADTGIGIDASALPGLFSAFAQVDGSATRRHGGAGLGLAIAQRLVGLMGGEVTVESRPGEGSRFGFELWLARVAVDDPRCPTAAPPLPPAEVVVVADNAACRDAVGTLLRSWGLTPRLLSTSAEALAVLRQTEGGVPPGALLVDAGLPAISELAEACRNAAVPLVGLAPAEGDAGISWAAKIAKPVRARFLREALGRVLVGAVVTSEGGEASPKPAAPRRRVLLVEDNRVNQRVARHILQRLGHEVQVAETGTEALACLERPDAGYDLILMDCQMPEMDGYEATRRIRRLPGPRARLPIVALTANGMERDRDRCLTAGMDDFLAKPVDRKDLEAIVDKWLGAASASAGPGPGSSSPGA